MRTENAEGVIERIESFLREEKSDKASCDFGSNIFEATGIVEKEVYMGNFLAELINPNGTHGQNFLYLDLFFERVLDTKRLSEQIIVHTEYPTENKRWVDIAIEDSKRFIPIEVKIKAGDQKNQCEDYVKIAKNSPLYYLTINGDKPSAYSTGGLTLNEIIEKIKPISWGMVTDWLKDCIKATGVEHGDTLMNLRQYLSAVKKLCLLDAMDNCRKTDRQKGLDAVMRDKISEALRSAVQQRNLGWRRLEKGVNTKDDGINYVLSDSENVFFRILCENGAIKAGKIFGLKLYDGDKENWIFSGAECDRQREEKYGKDWWVRVETIVTRNKSHLLFDEDGLQRYVGKIIKLYEEMR